MTCYDCGGVNLQVKYWVNANDLSDFKNPCDDDDYWCSDCEDHVSVNENYSPVDSPSKLFEI